jgi:hypothetical protein
MLRKPHVPFVESYRMRASLSRGGVSRRFQSVNSRARIGQGDRMKA